MRLEMPWINSVPKIYGSNEPKHSKKIKIQSYKEIQHESSALSDKMAKLANY